MENIDRDIILCLFLNLLASKIWIIPQAKQTNLALNVFWKIWYLVISKSFTFSAFKILLKMSAHPFCSVKYQNWFAIVEESLVQYHVIYCLCFQELHSHCILLIFVYLLLQIIYQLIDFMKKIWLNYEIKICWKDDQYL